MEGSILNGAWYLEVNDKQRESKCALGSPHSAARIASKCLHANLQFDF